MSDGLVFALVLIAFPFVFYWFWKGIVWLIARIGGWMVLAESFATDQPAQGQAFNMVSARFGLFANYSNCLKLSVSADGVHLSPIIFFRAGHQPLFIPWESIAELRPWHLWIFSSVRLLVHRGDGGKSITIRIYGRDPVNSLIEQAPPQLVQR